MDAWTDGRNGRRRRAVFRGSCSLYAYNDNRNGPMDAPRFIGGSGFFARRAATATPITHPFQTLTTGGPMDKPKLSCKLVTVPWRFEDGSYGFKDKQCWVLEIPATNTLTKKGTTIMTLKEELSKLYSDSTASKRKQFLDRLPDMLREKAKNGYESLTIYASAVYPLELHLSDIKDWCGANGLESKIVVWPLAFDSNITIYWG